MIKFKYLIIAKWKYSIIILFIYYNLLCLYPRLAPIFYWASSHRILLISGKDFERKTKKLHWSVSPPVYPSVHLSDTLSGKSVQRMRATFIIVSGNTRTRTRTHTQQIVATYFTCTSEWSWGSSEYSETPPTMRSVCWEIFSISRENYIITYAEWDFCLVNY